MKLVMVTEYLLVAEGDRRKGSWDGTGDEGVIKIMDEADLDQERAAGKPGGVWVGSLDSLPAWKAKREGGRGRPWWRRRARVRQGVRLWKCGEEGVDTPSPGKGGGVHRRTWATWRMGGRTDGARRRDEGGRRPRLLRAQPRAFTWALGLALPQAGKLASQGRGSERSDQPTQAK
jgi:hypothetical protein